MKLFTILCLLFLSSSIFAQSFKNKYAFGLNINLNRISTDAIIGGPEKPLEPILPSPDIYFQYTRVLSSGFELGLQSGIGVLATAVLVPGDSLYFGTAQYPIFTNINSLSTFLRMEASAGYRKKVNEKWSLGTHLGLGFRFFGKTSYGSTYYQDANLLYQLNYTTNNKPVSYFSVGTDLSYQLPNNNELTINLNYQHSFSNIFLGSYSLYNQSNLGDFYNRGRFFNIGLAYTFNSSKKIASIQHLQTKENIDRKAAKKAYRKQLRYIDPKSSFLKLSAGSTFMKTLIVEDPLNVMQAGSMPDFTPQISFETGLGRQFYLEGSVQTSEIWLTERYYSMPHSLSGYSGFRIFQLSCGALYRWILPNQYNVININAGLTSGFHFAQLGAYQMSFSSHNGATNDKPFHFSALTESAVTSRYIGSIYLGLSKDFRLLNRVYLSFAYRYNLGLKKVIESDVLYTDYLNNQSAMIKTCINGSGSEIQFGLKFKLK
jgi:hypothetical protein